MNHTMRSVGMAVLVLCTVASIGCAKKKAEETPPPVSTPAPEAVAFKVAGLELGNHIGADKKVVAPMTTFGPKDTIYVSIATEGATPNATLAAKWTFGDAGQLVNQMSETIAPTGPTATEFHITKPSGWPKGKYKVEVTLDGAPVGSKEFDVS